METRNHHLDKPIDELDLDELDKLIDEPNEPNELDESNEPNEPNESLASKPRSPRHWSLVLTGVIALSAGLVVGLPKLELLGQLELFGRQAIADTEDESTFLTVEATRLSPESTYSITRTYTGQVAALRSSEIGFENGGTLVWVGVDRGDRVTKGSPLARLDTRNLEARRAELVAQKNQAVAVLTELQRGPRQEDINAAEATVRDLEDQLELERIRESRREYLANEGAISQEALDEVSFGANALEDRLDAARSQLEELRTGTRPERIAAQEAAVQQLSASIANLDVTIEKSTIFAPFTGVIGERQQDEGTVVGTGQAIVRLVEAAQPEVEIGIPSDSLPTLPIGSSQVVEIDSDRYTTTVQTVLPELDPTTRTRTVILAVTGVSDTAVDSRPLPLGQIAPGQVARLNLQNTIQESGYWLPTTALVQGEKGLWNAYALVPDTEEFSSQNSQSSIYQIERRIVEVLHTEGDRVFVQ
ncbi:MAG: HlyD family efflux transporter periplasmic adaptor subunit, partial [Merismopedia sp. SIO2A8]|nr:HlyD family efflux transporter periplasmic adaptor subunit [Merismopedia sp. SIO2A8]